MVKSVLVTGNLGYIGPVLVGHLREAFSSEVELVGFDTGYFAHCLTSCDYLPESQLDRQIFGDVRRISPALFENVDAVVHLAAISNDPMGRAFEDVTNQINGQGALLLCKMAKAAGVSKFVFASSCSMYGEASGPPRKEGDPLNPLTTYSQSKVRCEEVLEQIADDDFTVTSLRFATACGMSPRLRLDLVLNDFVACAHLHRKIEVLSDGTPWRPLIDVADMARAVEWALLRRSDKASRYLAINVGSESWTWQIGDLARAVAEIIKGVEVTINENAAPDKRSYKVDFSLFQKLAPEHQPVADFENTVCRLHEGIKKMHFASDRFRESEYVRLKMLETHLADGRLDQNLFPLV